MRGHGEIWRGEALEPGHLEEEREGTVIPISACATNGAGQLTDCLLILRHPQELDILCPIFRRETKIVEQLITCPKTDREEVMCLIATPSLSFFTRLSRGDGGQWKRGGGHVLGVGAKKMAASDKHAGGNRTIKQTPKHQEELHLRSAGTQQICKN